MRHISVYDRQIIVPSIVAISVLSIWSNQKHQLELRKRLATLNYFRHRQKHFAFRRTQKINLELNAQELRYLEASNCTPRSHTPSQRSSSRYQRADNHAAVQGQLDKEA